MNSITNNTAGMTNPALYSRQAAVSYERITVMTDTTVKSTGMKPTRDIVDVSSGNQFNAQLILEKVNGQIAGAFGETGAIDVGVLSSSDTSPENTAKSIFDFAVSFYDAYKEQHAGEDEAEVLDSFMSTIRSAIDDGFAEALEILSGMSVFNDEMSADIDDTYSNLQEMLNDFYEEQQEEMGL